MFVDSSGRILTSRHQVDEQQRQQMRDKKIKQILVEVLKEPAMQEIAHGRLPEVPGD
jgi:hypothetical protein